LETITSGVCKIGDRDVNEIEPADRDIAMVFQNYALYPHMSVYDNMAYGLRNRGMPKPEIDKRVRETAALLAIEDYLARKPRALSGGQRQRVAMGRAIVREPQVFLFDEPLSNLDAKLRVTMRLEIRRLHNRLNATSIFVTHDQVEAMTLADQVVVMNAGKIEQIGAPGEVYKHPASLFVASFIGAPAMNLMPGKVIEPGIVETPGGKLYFDASRFAASGEVEVGIRPEDIHAGDSGGIAFTPELVEELGATRLLHGTFGATPIIVAIPASGTTHENKEMRLSIEPAAVHLFDKATGRSLAKSR